MKHLMKIFLIEPRKTDNYAKVTFDKNLYSSSPKYAQENVSIKASSDKVWILNQSYEIIMEHPRLYGNGLESMNWLPYIDLMSRRPGAMKYTTFFIRSCLITGRNILEAKTWMASEKA